MTEAGEETERKSTVVPERQDDFFLSFFSRLVLIEEKERAENSLDWAVLASMGLVKTPRPISERAARENIYRVSGFRPSTAYDPAGMKVTWICKKNTKNRFFPPPLFTVQRHPYLAILDLRPSGFFFSHETHQTLMKYKSLDVKVGLARATSIILVLRSFHVSFHVCIWYIHRIS